MIFAMCLVETTRLCFAAAGPLLEYHSRELKGSVPNREAVVAYTAMGSRSHLSLRMGEYWLVCLRLVS